MTKREIKKRYDINEKRKIKKLNYDLSDFKSLILSVYIENIK